MQKDRAIIITTHAMEEADALCSRIGIVKNGKLATIGNQLHLKSKWGSGLKLVVRVNFKHKFDSIPAFEKSFESIEVEKVGLLERDVIERICSVARLFSKSDTYKPGLLARYAPGQEMVWSSTIQFVIAMEGADIASIFQSIESNVEDLGIIDWAVNQTTLEDVFIKVVEG